MDEPVFSYAWIRAKDRTPSTFPPPSFLARFTGDVEDGRQSWLCRRAASRPAQAAVGLGVCVGQDQPGHLESRCSSFTRGFARTTYVGAAVGRLLVDQ